MGEVATAPAAEGFSHLWRILGQLVAPTTLVTVLLVYFAWARTTVIYEVFGISYSTLNLTVDDLLLRSISTTFTPVALTLFMLLLVRPAHTMLVRSVRKNRTAQKLVPRVVSVAGILMVGAGALGFVRVLEYRVEWPLVPMSIGLGLLLVGYGSRSGQRALRARRLPNVMGRTHGRDTTWTWLTPTSRNAGRGRTRSPCCSGWHSRRSSC